MSVIKTSDRLANVVAMPFAPTRKAAILAHASLAIPEIPTLIVTTSMNVKTTAASVAGNPDAKMFLALSNAYVSTEPLSIPSLNVVEVSKTNHKLKI